MFHDLLSFFFTKLSKRENFQKMATPRYQLFFVCLYAWFDLKFCLIKSSAFIWYLSQSFIMIFSQKKFFFEKWPKKCNFRGARTLSRGLGPKILLMDLNVFFYGEFKNSIKNLKILGYKGSRVPRMATPWGKTFLEVS